MDISWYDRVAEDLESTLAGRCGLLEELIKTGIVEFSFQRIHKHPSIAVLFNNIEEPGELSGVIPIHFDPFNQEFYTSPASDDEIEVRFVFKTPADLISHIDQQAHALFDNEYEEEIS